MTARTGTRDTATVAKGQESHLDMAAEKPNIGIIQYHISPYHCRDPEHEDKDEKQL